MCRVKRGNFRPPKVEHAIRDHLCVLQIGLRCSRRCDHERQNQSHLCGARRKIGEWLSWSSHHFSRAYHDVGKVAFDACRAFVPILIIWHLMAVLIECDASAMGKAIGVHHVKSAASAMLCIGVPTAIGFVFGHVAKFRRCYSAMVSLW